MSHKISVAVQEEVRRRANFLCEYCHTDERWQYIRFTIDHVTPRAAGGGDESDNLALACASCNRRKSHHQTAPDPFSAEPVPLFDPRRDLWSDHFIWSADGVTILPLTPVGRATVSLLAVNNERALAIRLADLEVKRHPPEGDPISVLNA